MSYTSEKIHSFCSDNNITCTPDDADNFNILYQMLVEFNKHTNVTALKTEEDICTKHFVDSLYPLAFSVIPDNSKVIDIGCGAGFPGLPLKLMKRDIDISFVDSTEKKLKFTKSVSDKFSLDAKTYPVRAEELIAKGHREKYDVCVSRAVASLQVLCELCLPFVKQGGMFIAYKSKKECDVTDKSSELFMSQKAIQTLGGKVEKILDAPIADDNGNVYSHALIVIKKVKHTPDMYPRRYPVILKKPL